MGWMQVGDLAPTFSNLYPEILDPHISEEQFRRLVEHINRELIAAFSPYSARNVLDTILSVATFWLWEDFGFAAVKGRLDKLERFIADWNSNVGMKEGIALIPLRRTGYMSLDFQIPDPQIGLEMSVTLGRIQSTWHLNPLAPPHEPIQSFPPSLVCIYLPHDCERQRGRSHYSKASVGIFRSWLSYLCPGWREQDRIFRLSSGSGSMLVTVEGHHSSLRFAEEVGMVACLALEIPYCSCSRGDQVHFQK